MFLWESLKQRRSHEGTLLTSSSCSFMWPNRCEQQQPLNPWSSAALMKVEEHSSTTQLSNYPGHEHWLTQRSTQWTYCKTITWHFSSHTAWRDNSVKACVEHRAAASVLFHPTASARGNETSSTLNHPGSYVANPSPKRVQGFNQSKGPPVRCEDISIFSGLTSTFGTWRVGLKKGSQPVTLPGADGSTQFCFLFKRSTAT